MFDRYDSRIQKQLMKLKEFDQDLTVRLMAVGDGMPEVWKQTMRKKAGARADLVGIGDGSDVFWPMGLQVSLSGLIRSGLNSKTGLVVSWDLGTAMYGFSMLSGG